MHPWLRDLRHDLVKRAVWPARDLRDTGTRDAALLRRGLSELVDGDGARVDALTLWRRMRAESPSPSGALDAFEAALKTAVSSLEKPWPAPLDAVLALEPAFAQLAAATPES